MKYRSDTSAYLTLMWALYATTTSMKLASAGCTIVIVQQYTVNTIAVLDSAFEGPVIMLG